MKMPDKEIKQVQQQLQGMLDVDQRVITPDANGNYNAEAIMQVRIENTTKLKDLVGRYGWIAISQFGEEASTAAWFIIQHADQDIAFQRHCLSLMEKLPEGEVSKHDIAYLTDRILVAENKLQRYGSQFDDRESYLVVKPVEDLPNLNRRRLAMGLDTIEEHIAVVEDAFQQKVFLSVESDSSE